MGDVHRWFVESAAFRSIVAEYSVSQDDVRICGMADVDPDDEWQYTAQITVKRVRGHDGVTASIVQMASVNGDGTRWMESGRGIVLTRDGFWSVSEPI